VTNILPTDEVDRTIAEGPWKRQTDRLVLEHRFSNFKEAMRFVNQVAELAEQKQHHPDIFISWNLVRLELWTHSAGGITTKDLDLAKEIETLLTKQ
jgi:4a-hydroxytetrahydrobiopterin dehydratase